MAANGCGWSCNYHGILYADPNTSKLPPIARETGLLLFVRTLHFLHIAHHSNIHSLKQIDNINVFHCPDYLFSTIPDADSFVSRLLIPVLGIPTTGANSLATLLFSQYGRRRRQSSDMIVMLFDLEITAVVRNNDEFRDWFHGGTMNSVVIKTLRATKQAIESLEKTKYSDSCKRAPAREVECEECMVCLEEYAEGEEVTWLPCGHGYHGRCIGEWLMGNHQCPICRSPMPWVGLEYTAHDEAMQQTSSPAGEHDNSRRSEDLH